MAFSKWIQLWLGLNFGLCSFNSSNFFFFALNTMLIWPIFEVWHRLDDCRRLNTSSSNAGERWRNCARIPWCLRHKFGNFFWMHFKISQKIIHIYMRVIYGTTYLTTTFNQVVDALLWRNSLSNAVQNNFRRIFSEITYAATDCCRTKAYADSSKIDFTNF